MGIDFEFNKVSKTERDVALIQLNLETDDIISYIFILSPHNIKIDNLKILIKLLTNPNIIKILHGSESLDIPYLFNQLIIDKKLIDNFCNNFYDTKFICDYINFKYNKKNSCSIYELLYSHNIINKKQLNKLDKIEKKMGPIYLIQIDIYKIDKYLLQYALYDVLYLPQLIKYFLKLYKKPCLIISEITNIINKYKRNIDDTFIKLEKIINNMNNYFIKNNSNKNNLQYIWNKYYLSINNKYFNIFKQINYFKQFFKIITKLYIYNNINNKYDIHINNKNKLNKFILNKYILWINKYKYIRLLVYQFKDLNIYFK